MRRPRYIVITDNTKKLPEAVQDDITTGRAHLEFDDKDVFRIKLSLLRIRKKKSCYL